MPPERAIVDWPADLHRENGLRVSARGVTVRGCTYLLGRTSTIDVEAREPRSAPLVGAIVLAALAIPAALATTEPGFASRWPAFLLTLVVLIAGVRLLSFTPRYCVVLRTLGRAPQVLFESDDHRLAIGLTAALRHALADCAGSG
jgi:hypothetical protein